MQRLSALRRRIVALFRRDHGDRAAQDTGRRKVLVGGVSVAAASAVLLPKSWTAPVLRSIVVPAHAQTTETDKDKDKGKKDKDKGKHKPTTTRRPGTSSPPFSTLPPLSTLPPVSSTTTTEDLQDNLA